MAIDGNILSSKAIEQIRALIRSEGKRQEVLPKPTRRRHIVPQRNVTEVVYDLNRYAEIPSGASTNMILNKTYPYLWYKAGYRLGAETFIELDYDETSPSTNGNFIIKKSGIYKFTFHGQCYVEATTDFSSEDYTIQSEDASTGGSHYHNVVLPGTLWSMRHAFGAIRYQLYRKPSGESIDFYQDNRSEYVRSHFYAKPSSAGTDAARAYVNISAVWHVPLNVDDRIAIKASLEYSTYVPDIWQYHMRDGWSNRMAVERISEKQDWVEFS